MIELNFLDFLVTESKVYFGHKIGDVLTALHDLEQNKDSMGTRQLVANSERLVNQMRRILKTNWSKREEKYLKQLQKVAVAIARGLEEKHTLPDVLSSAANELEQLMQKLGMPVNSLVSQDIPQKPEEDGVADPHGKKERQGHPQKQQGQAGPQGQEQPIQPNAAPQQQPAQVPPFAG